MLDREATKQIVRVSVTLGFKGVTYLAKETMTYIPEAGSLGITL